MQSFFYYNLKYAIIILCLHDFSLIWQNNFKNISTRREGEQNNDFVIDKTFIFKYQKALAMNSILI
jgi:hypothetical protein